MAHPSARIARLTSTHKPRRPPLQILPTLIEREYGNALASMLSAKLVRAAFAELLAELPALIESAKQARAVVDGLHTDAGESKRARDLIGKARERLKSAINEGSIRALAERTGEQTAAHNRAQMNRQTRAVLGADIFTGDRGMRARLEHFVDENVALIKDVPDEVATQVERLVTRAITSGTSNRDLAKQLQEGPFGFGERRAKVIARDQIGKVYGQINAARQQELGVKRFIWRTVGDERVREDPKRAWNNHAAINGQTFSFDDLPLKGGYHPNGAIPGEPINCRCSAEPVYDDVLADIDAEIGEIPDDKPGSENEAPVQLAAIKPREPVRERYSTMPQITSANATPEEREAITTYAGGEYRAINAKLRGVEYWGSKLPGSYELSNGKTIDQTVKALDKAVGRSKPIEKPVTLYRGVTEGLFKPGQTITDKAFQSTSTTRSVASGFAGKTGKVLEIHAPIGTRVLDVSTINGGAEAEMLLARGTRFRVVSTKGNTIKLEIVPPRPDLKRKRATKKG